MVLGVVDVLQRVQKEIAELFDFHGGLGFFRLTVSDAKKAADRYFFVGEEPAASQPLSRLRQHLPGASK